MERKVYRMEIKEDDLESGVFALSLVESPAIESNFVYLSKQLEMVKLATVNEEKRIIVGPALIPNKNIERIDEKTGEVYDIVFPEETVRMSAHLYLKRHMNNNTTIEHEKSVDDISVVESWIVEDSQKDKSAIYGLDNPVGTWMVAMKVNNDQVWEEYVKTGKVKGISLEGAFDHKEIEMSNPDDDIVNTIKDILQGYSGTHEDE